MKKTSLQTKFQTLFAVTVILSAAAVVLLLPSEASANVTQQKYYKSAFGEKPKCTACHTDKMPKKADGKHELNEYGHKVMAAAAGKKPKKATYEQVGPASKN